VETTTEERLAALEKRVPHEEPKFWYLPGSGPRPEGFQPREGYLLGRCIKCNVSIECNAENWSKYQDDSTCLGFLCLICADLVDRGMLPSWQERAAEREENQAWRMERLFTK
jgi:hypothetical protein